MNLSEDARIIYQGQTRATGEKSIWLSRVQAGFERVGVLWSARRQRAREIRELSTFSDRELWDLGLGRSDLPSITNGTFRRD